MTQPVADTGSKPAARQAAEVPTGRSQNGRVISQPGEVAALVVAQMAAVNAKKDELTIAIKALTDTTQQLARAYAGQAQLIQQLAARVRVLEAQAGATAAERPAA
jgi:hypothetical protein